MKTIVIVGAGFSGTALAVNLLRMATPGSVQLVLVNRSGAQARGVAYGTRSAKHILNVPAGNMSALTDHPGHFFEFCARTDPLVRPESFVSRERYGSYLAWLLDRSALGKQQYLTRIEAEVDAIAPTASAAGAPRWRVQLSGARVVLADEVVLAVGNFPPRNFPVPNQAFYDSRRYIRDPWSPGALDAIPADAGVLLLGTGLTAIDVANVLARADGRRKCYAVSRRGLLPQPHRCIRPGRTPEAGDGLRRAMGSDVRTYVRAIRATIRHARETGADWRDVLGSLRAHTPSLWACLSLKEKRRFLRHVQPFWDVHRHRLAPEAHLYFHGALHAGDIALIRARVLDYRVFERGIQVTIRRRGVAEPETLSVEYVVNCTGPTSDLRAIDDPLFVQLRSDGLLRSDALGLGLEVDGRYQCLGQTLAPVEGLRYLGPLLKARYWEATAVPELRVHAQALARELLADT
ncbi:hypothetical protein PCA31118_03401 [Pandoraea captiosa]|uniref:FAD-dependent urate hydroxylase HpyO/Asp monooxygenase CreE-like FAD/NAD(P)-binding domain-containing protein n=1 Tax=Pandoraea captiosa TaxID=2508302 RepID=A0A5E5A8J3_9BURK|nr:FAD/NAD(P)-binding protein [Pandoraea captiosa]VVE70021.1 hypothetical protein PCA31118_03401 [Pandoraea captiosa]